MKSPNWHYYNANNVRVENKKALETIVVSFFVDQGPRLIIEKYNLPMAIIKKNDSNS